MDQVWQVVDKENQQIGGGTNMDHQHTNRSDYKERAGKDSSGDEG
jgi:hypothetical protein